MQEKKRISTLSTFHKRRPPGPTVMYFAGGYLRRSLDVLECFDPLTLKWTILSPLSVPKSGLGAAYVGMVNTVLRRLIDRDIDDLYLYTMIIFKRQACKVM